MQHHREDVTLECYPPVITLTTLVHCRPKVGNYVSSCTGTNYCYTVYLKYLNMNTQEQQMFDYTKWKLHSW